jgi:prokaryotic ubiquitin-like protein Pup
MRREQRQRQDRRGDGETTAPTAAGQDRRERIKGDTDALLDEVDDVLEDNAAEFVRSYVQKGGE